MLLTADDLAALTGKVRPAAQRGVLLALGIPFKVRPDGFGHFPGKRGQVLGAARDSGEACPIRTAQWWRDTQREARMRFGGYWTVKSMISRWLRRAAYRLDPISDRNPATILGELAPGIPRDEIEALERFCDQEIEIPATTVYTVTAYRWGDLDGPSYPVGCYATEAEAVKAAQDEEADRGLKYSCEVVEWTIGVGIKELGGMYPFNDSASPVRIVRSPEA